MKRIVLHWTGGGRGVSEADREHYHFIVAGDCSVVIGDHAVEDNEVTSDDDYAAHTRGCNTGAIGVALAGMAGAVERPFSAGVSPITERQLGAACALVARLCGQYGIPVTPRTVLTHAEVQPTLGIPQRGKWDIARLPWDPSLVGPIPVGDLIRRMVIDAAQPAPRAPVSIPTNPLHPGSAWAGAWRGILAALGR